MIAPGTVMDVSAAESLNPLEGIPKIIWEKGGLMLGQLKKLTGLDAPAVQNWINRGYVAPPRNKYYSKDACARILIINALRESLKLEQITGLISYVNGSLVDASDDLIADSDLYALFCAIVSRLYDNLYITDTEIKRKIDDLTEEYQNSGARERIRKVLTLMCVCYQSILIKRRVEGLISELDGRR